MRRFFTIQLTGISDEDQAHILDICIGTAATQRLCVDKSELAVKTTQELIDKKVAEGIPESVLFPAGKTTEHSEDAMVALMKTEAWQDPSWLG